MFRGGAGEMVQCASRGMVMERRWKSSSSSREIAPSCPRCASPNTKFCYYNNYSHSQPRYFCKGCRRYWTKGGSLRNVPIGGGCRKNRRSKSVSSRTSPPTDPVSLTFCRTLNSSNRGSQNLTTSSTDTSTTDAPNIDLAAVFAKFFNQHENLSSDRGLPVLPPAALASHSQVVVDVDSPFSLTASYSSSSELVPIQFPEEQVHAQQQQQQQQQAMLMIECDDVVVTQDVLFIGGYEFGLEDEANWIPQYIEYPDPNGHGFQPMLSDEISQATALWSGTGPNFSWQTPQIEGLEPVVAPAEDHNLTFHPNVLLNEDCGSLDLSSYGVSSSRPY